MTMGVDLLRDGLLRVGEAPPEEDGEELERWAERARALGAEPHSSDRNPPASGPCVVCVDKPGSVRCLQCQRVVCAAHSWVMLGLCKACLPEERMKQARAPRLAPRPDLGIKWVED